MAAIGAEAGEEATGAGAAAAADLAEDGWAGAALRGATATAGLTDGTGFAAATGRAAGEALAAGFAATFAGAALVATGFTALAGGAALAGAALAATLATAALAGAALEGAFAGAAGFFTAAVAVFFAGAFTGDLLSEAVAADARGRAFSELPDVIPFSDTLAADLAANESSCLPLSAGSFRTHPSICSMATIMFSTFRETSGA